MVEERQRQRTDFGRFSPDINRRRGYQPPHAEPYRPSRTPKNWDDIIKKGPYRPREIPNPGDYIKPYNLSSNFNQLDNSGIMLALANNPTVNRIQSIYNRVDPLLPEVDFGNQRVGYDINRDLWGGNLNIGGEYDVDDNGYQFGINWSKSF